MTRPNGVYFQSSAEADRLVATDAHRLSLVERTAGESFRGSGFAAVDEMVPAIAAAARPGDVVVAMSNGAFGGIWGKLLEALGRG